MRVIIALLVASLVVACYAAIIWAFAEYIWPALPPWLAMICFIAVAVFAIGSPIWWLARWSNRTIPGVRGNRRDGAG